MPVQSHTAGGLSWQRGLGSRASPSGWAETLRAVGGVIFDLIQRAHLDVGVCACSYTRAPAGFTRTSRCCISGETMLTDAMREKEQRTK